MSNIDKMNVDSSTVEEMSKEVSNKVDITSIQSPIYDIFEQEMEDISTDSYQYIKYYDVNLSNADTVDYFRVVVNEKQNWHLLCKSYVEVKLKVTQPDGTAWNNHQNVALQNNGVGTFVQWDLKFDDELVERVDDADINNTIQNLVYYSGEYSSSIAKNKFWYPDTVNAIKNDVDVNALVAGTGIISQLNAINLGQFQRQKLLDNSTLISFQIPLCDVFGLMKSMKHVSKGIKYELQLKRNVDNRLLYCANPSKTVIQEVSWYVPRVKPNVSVIPMIENKLRDNSFHFSSYIDTQIFRSNLITQAASNSNFKLNIKRKRPVKVFVAFQAQNRVDGDQTIGKRIFDHIRLTTLRCVLNSTTQFPEREYITQFEANSNDYARVYSELMRCGLKDHTIDQGSVITYDNFKSLFPIFAIDLSEKQEYNVRPESALMEIFWSNNTENNYYMWVLVESERQIVMTGVNGALKYIRTD